MAFYFYLEIPASGLTADEITPEALEAHGTAVSPPDLEDYFALCVRACHLLSNTDLRVHIGGFGEAEWYFDIGYDFSAFMESFPALIRALASGDQFELDLYPQGLERTLVFRPGPGETEIRCVSRTSWTPDPDHELMPSHALEDMLVTLGTDFARALEMVDERLSNMEPFASWKERDFGCRPDSARPGSSSGPSPGGTPSARSPDAAAR